MKKLHCLLFCLVLLLSISGCKKEEAFSSPADLWRESFKNFLSKCDDGRSLDIGAVENLQYYSAKMKEKVLAYEKIDQHPDAKAFFLVVAQLADALMAKNTPLFDLPAKWIQGIWAATNSLSEAAHAKSAQEYYEIIDLHAWSWLDAFYGADDVDRIVVPEEIAWDTDR